jgi:putative flavoprotein involved in K+ transport
VPTIIVEKNDRPGDSWRNRYKSLCLHDPVWYDHLPYIQFPDHWPVFSPKDKIGDWLEMYTKVMELNYWTRTTAKSATCYDEAKGEWTVKVNRDGEEVVLKPKQLVLATGMSGVPNMPEVSRHGQVQGRSAPFLQHPGPDAYKGKKAVVIGSNNSAHDICAALWEAMRRDHGAALVDPYRAVRHADGGGTRRALFRGGHRQWHRPPNKADLIFASLPYAMLPSSRSRLCDEMKKRDAEFYDRGSRRPASGSIGAMTRQGLFMKYLRRGSGYYIDIGASQLIIDGEIKLVRGQVDRGDRGPASCSKTAPNFAPI